MCTIASPVADVIIVGAGPIGLTLASLLRREGRSVLVLEAHPGFSRHPKARGISARSMETFRALGLESAIRAVSLPGEHVRFFRGASLADPAAEVTAPPAADEAPNTPAAGVLCSQDRLEPVLAAAALAAGADIRTAHRVTAVRQDDAGAEVDVEHAGGTSVLRARYVVGCDGARSLTREAAGIALTGERDLARFLSVRIEAPLGEAVRGREATSYFISGGKGGFLAVDNDREWIYQYPVADGTDAAALREDHGRLVGLVRDAAGIPDLPVEIVDTMLWRMDARIADSFRAGRILLAGDAAHQTPPTGGHGMNVGIGDAETLAWQLATVLRGEATEELLDRYTAERRPVGAAVIEVSLGNAGRAYGIDDELLLASGYAPAAPLAAGEYAPSGEPGRRLPHVPLTGDAHADSSLDLAAGGFRLVTAAVDPDWAAAVSGLVPPVALAPLAAGERAERTPGSFAERAGLGEGEALLVRPDGHIAARLAGGAHRGPRLAAALRSVLGAEAAPA